MTENERRKFLKASLASLAGAAGVSLPGCESYTACCYDMAIEPEPVKEETPPAETTPTDAAAEKAARREELTKELEELGKTEPEMEPDDIDAMCYVMAEDWEDFTEDVIDFIE